MSIKSHLESAEESIRQALINALAEGDDEYLSDLFDMLNKVRNLHKTISNTIRLTDNIEEWEGKYNFNLSSSYLNSPDNPDVIKFPIDYSKIDLGLD